MNKLLYIDTETTGLYPNKHGLTQVAAIAVINGEEVGKLNLDINPFTYPTPRLIDEKALEITGKTEKMLKTYYRQEVAFKQFTMFLWQLMESKDDVWQIAGYNTPFDTGFLKAWFKANETKYTDYITYREIDILALVRHMQYWGLLNTEDAKLGTLCKHYHIELDAHDAMNDIIATRELYIKLVQHLADADIQEMVFAEKSP